ncbi:MULTISPECIES: lysophospholipid acyltransferase family protein [Lacticaseibacillus]|uniref:1-acyl-sn-glycerol-3-phosphate acyltransferase n=2 Tax=Lacticaseibacillus TaxID=2759736 RepID=A0AAN1EYC2_LACCA|nr:MULTISPECIES: 1-acyl-sn-glycerol-3-phosphate acyltransferase [Lacticaseibacillus]ARY91111.1 acyl-phosphate glycerol 3-phosphate acyltransferase [Lacticaseibacillus casei]KAB1969143.1 acyl-phosphate glycerol 3-phosphate acyltransferase [Lacticaseibacillus casei]WLV81724.1 1-acyl-sn-glycerol-3-phosphate acyltransferase [Lacticaseibacillus sp. NCIMB 15473]WNX25674.1 1-acyl-sn-glycerol-3-phosphate acyltransferase [Lacticaseibacillus casei]WNX28445.1 1-acyl-sn-glycerol-3-phosphate acyltransferas
MAKVLTYRRLTDDVVAAPNQNSVIPANYRWQPTRGFRLKADLVYGGSWLFAQGYCRIKLHVRNRQAFRQAAGRGYFVYGNHTQPFGDVFTPMRVNQSRRVFTLASAANLSVPVLGRLVPYGGGVLVPRRLHQLRDFNAEIRQLIQAKHVVMIYPEAHVWPYYTGIRPFETGAFHYPVELDAPVFVTTMTYQKRHWRRKPRRILYVDGPFWPDRQLPIKLRQQKLAQQVKKVMTNRATLSNTEYIRYQQEGRARP